MLTIIKSNVYSVAEDGKFNIYIEEANCLSSDIKPTEHIVNGSTIMEIDTTKVFKFNEEDKEWVELG